MTNHHKALACAVRSLQRVPRRSKIAGLLTIVATMPLVGIAAEPEVGLLKGYWPAWLGLLIVCAIAALCVISIRNARRNSQLDSIAVWKTLAENIAEVVILLDKDGNTVYMNRAFDGREIALGTPVEQLFDEIERTRWQKTLAEVSTNLVECSTLVLKVRMPDGIRAFWEVRLTRVAEGPVEAAYMCCGRDVTGARRRELTRTVLNKISLAASRVDTIEELMEFVAEQLGKIVDTTNFFVALYHPETDSYTRPLMRDLNEVTEAPGARLDLRGGLTDYVRRTGKPLLLNDFNRDELVALESVRPLGHRAACWLGIPLRARDGVIGVYVLQSYENPNQYSEADIELLSIVAGSLGRAVERQRANTDLREREARLRILTERMPALLWTQNLDGTINYVSGAALQQLELCDSDLVGRNMLEVLSCEGLNREKVQHEVLEGHVISMRLSRNQRIFDAYLEPSLSPSGMVVGAIGVALDVTEQARKDEELRSYFNLSADALLVLDAEGILLRCNAAWERMLGYGQGELIGSTPFQFVHPDDLELVLGAIADHRQGIPAIGMDVRVKARDDQYKWISFNGVSTPENGIIYVSGKDTTYRREIEAALREREEQLRLFAEYSPVPLAMFDRNMRYIVASKRWYNDYKLGEKSIIGKSHYEVFPEVTDRWKEVHKRCLNGYGESCARDSLPKDDGSLDWVRWEIRPWYNSENEIGGIIMLTEVITAEVEAEAELAMSRTLARQIVDSSLDAVVAIDGTGFITEWNPQAEHVFGYSKDEAIGDFVHNLIVPERYRDACRRGLEDFARTGNSAILNRVLKVSFLRKNGDEFPCELSIAPIQVSEEAHFAGFIRDVSEQVVNQREIQQSREKLREAQRIAGLGFWEWYAADDAMYLSDEKLDLYGRPDLKMPITFEAFMGMVHPDDRVKFFETHGKLIEGKDDFDIEYRVSRPSGEIKYVFTQGKVVRLPDGSIEKFYGTTLDITERVLSEQRVRESEQRLALAIEGSQDGFWDWNLVSGDCYCSSKFVEWFECDPEQFVHHQDFIDSLMLPEDLEDFRNAFQEHAEGRTPYIQIEERYQTVKGNWFWVLTRGKILEWNDDGTPLRAAGTSTNITARKLIEERATQLGRILDNSMNEVFVVDPESGTILEANQRACQRTGYTLAELQGMSIANLHSDSTADDLRYLVEPLLSGESMIVRKIGTHLCKDGTEYPYETVVQIMDWHGRRVFVSIGMDISERKVAEAEYQNLQTQLRHSQRLETIGTLAGGIAHDFNNILTPILGYADMAANDLPAESPLRQDIDHVIQAAYRAKGLVQQILAFSRRSEQSYQPLRIDLVIQEALNLLRSTLPRNVELVKRVHPVGNVMSDPTQIHQVIMNLCTNAYHAMEERGGTLEVELQETELDPFQYPCTSHLAQGTYVKMVVKDSGVGMSAQTVERIFEPFFTTKEVGIGTGLGLSVVHGIIASHLGAIHVASELGQGTTVTIWLPVAEELTSENQDDDPALLQGSEHVMICDEDETIALLARQMLESHGYTVSAFSDPVAALVALQESPLPFDVLIVDDVMSLFSGSDVAGAAHDFNPDLSVILLSSGVVPGEGDGDFAHKLSKPVSSAELARAVRMVLTAKTPLEV